MRHKSELKKIRFQNFPDLVVVTSFVDRHCDFHNQVCRGFIKFLCRRSVVFFSWAFLVFVIKES